jgi:hypothetical protein
MYGASIVIENDAQRIHVKNNLCYSPLTDSVYIYHQNYYSTPPVTRMTGTQFNAADAGVDQLSGNLSASPGVNGDYTLSPGSPAIDAGIATLYGVDYFGVTVPYNATTDIGVSEYVPAATGGKHVTVAGAGSHTGEDVSNAWTMAEANTDAVAGDTVYIHAGTYTTQISPVNAGSAGSPIVFRNYSSDVCSLYTNTACIAISTDYVIVQGIAAKLNPAVANQVVNMTGVEHSAILNCRLYGGTTSNTETKGDWLSVELNDVRYCRFIGNTLDRLDVDICDDLYRGDGVALYGANSHYNIIEGNFVKNVSHFAFAIPAYTNDARFNILRNNVAWDCHGMYGTGDGAKHALYEGNRAWNPGQIDTYQSGPAMEMFADSTIVRYNMMAHDTTVTKVGTQCVSGWGKFVEAGSELIIEGSTSPYDAEKDGRYYGNAFTAQVTFPPGYTGSEYKYALTILDGAVDGFGYNFGRNVIKNSIIAYSTGTRLIYYQNSHTDYTTISDTLDGNVLWNGTPGEDVLTTQTTDHSGDYTLAEAKSTFPSIRSSNLNVSPLWVDSTSGGVARSYEISGTSLCRDAGVALTLTASSSASGQKIVNVGDATYFHYDWGASPYDRGDSLLIGTQRVELDSVDYGNNRLIVKTNLGATISAGSAVHVLGTWNSQTSTYTTRLSGSAPDIGPYEYGAGAPNPPGSIPDTTTLIAPADGSTQAQPITFRWRSVTGATKYWIDMSLDGWATSFYSNAALVDTFVTVSGFPSGGTVVWNITTGNSVGWNTSSWGSWWTVKVGESPAWGDTITVNWNNVSESETMTGNTIVQMVNVRSRDNILIVRNPLGGLVSWPSTITWLGSDASPQPEAGGTSAYLFVRDSATRVIGVDLSQLSGGGGGGVSASWVLMQLASYLRSDADIILSGDQVYRKIGLIETTTTDTVWLEDDGGLLRLTDYSGSYLLSDLAGGGASDGQDADSLRGKPLSPYRPAAGKSVVTYDPDSTGYRHVPIVGMDTTGALNGVGKKLVLIGGEIVVRNDSVGAGGSADSSVFATKFFSNSTYAPLAHSHAGSYVGVGDTSGMMRRSDSSWFMSKEYADDYLPITGGTVTGVTKFTLSDTVGAYNSSGPKYRTWRNTNGGVRVGVGTTATLTFTRVWTDGVTFDFLSNLRTSNQFYWKGLHYFDTLTVNNYITAGAYVAGTLPAGVVNVLNNFNSNVGFLLKPTSTGGGRPFLIKTSADADVFEVAANGTVTSATAGVFAGKSTARIDSASLVIAMAGTSWLATTNTDSTSGPILFPKYFVVDSVMVALVGTASTDTVKVDVRYGPDYSAAGTAVVTTPSQIAASGLWTRTVPNSATIPAFNSVWVKVTKKVGTSKRLTVMLKGRWQ